MTNERRGSGLDPMTVVTLAAIVLIVVFQVVVFSFGNGKYGDTPGPGSTGLWAILWLALGIGVVLVLIRVTVTFRIRRLARRFPSALVLAVIRSEQLKAELRQLELSGRLSYNASLAFDNDGLSLRGKDPARMLALSWSEIRSIQPTLVREGGRRSNAIEVTAVRAGKSLVLPFIVVGYGVGGLFPPTTAVIEAIVAKCESYRPASTAKRVMTT